MYLGFIDEAGYAKGDWASNADEQPIFVHAGVIINCDKLNALYSVIKNKISRMLEDNNILEVEPGVTSSDWVAKLGSGLEIKAKNVDTGAVPSTLKPIRGELMSIFLGTHDSLFNTILVVVHKKRHKEIYKENAFNVYEWSLNLLAERIHFHANRRSASVSLIIDETPEEDDYVETLDRLKNSGSVIFSKNSLSPDPKFIKLNSIKDIYFGRSSYSLGLQIADFYARYTYSAFKKGDPGYPGWSLIKDALDRNESGQVLGYGLKCEPDDFNLEVCKKMLKD